MKLKYFSFHIKKLSQSISHNDKVNIMLFKYGTSVLLFLLCGWILVAIQGESPTAAMAAMFQGAVGSLNSLGNTLRWTAPCIVTGAAAIVAFKAGVVNLGIAGQATIGGFVAGVIGAFYHMPPLVHIPFILIMSALFGLIWSIIPAVLRLLFNAHEFITTLMMNYVADYLTRYLVQRILKSGAGNMGLANMEATPTILESAMLPDFIPGTSASLAVPIAFFVAFCIAFFYRRTIQGYELKQVGENLSFARAGGVKVVKQYLLIFLLSGFIAGLNSGLEICGTYKKFNCGFASNMGWDGVSIARIAELNPIALLFVSFIWAALKAGALQMERMIGVDRQTVQILQYLFVLFVSVDYEGIYMQMKNNRRIKKYLKEGVSRA